MKKERFEELRAKMRAAMPDFMLTFEKEYRAKPCPDFSLKKNEYIQAWIRLFGPHLTPGSDGKTQGEERFAKYSKESIRAGFEWARDNFAELDLGGNMKWFAPAIWVAASVNGKTWDEDRERTFILRRIYGTRWAKEGLTS